MKSIREALGTEDSSDSIAEVNPKVTSVMEKYAIGQVMQLFWFS